jgi:hypothetical protein
MYSPEKLTTLFTQDRERRQTKQKPNIFMMTSMSLKDKYNVLVSGKYQDLFLIFRTMSSKLKIRKYFDYNCDTIYDYNV